MSTVTRNQTSPLSVDEYEQMVEDGTIGEHERVELIEGRVVAKMPKGPEHSTSSGRCQRALVRAIPPGWHVRKEEPIRIPLRASELEPDLAIVRGEIEDYSDHHPEPADIALVVEVARSSVDEDRKLARTYAGGGIPSYWIVNVNDRQLEVYADLVGGAYTSTVIRGETESVELTIEGQFIGLIAVADLLPRRQ
jgi:Uma2 family endonuclease